MGETVRWRHIITIAHRGKTTNRVKQAAIKQNHRADNRQQQQVANAIESYLQLAPPHAGLARPRARRTHLLPARRPAAAMAA